MEMDMDPISSEEINLIKELRDNVSDLKLVGHCDTDIFYLKWLRARDFSVERAEEMLRKNILWREENDIDNILTWEPECATVPVDYPVEICGYNKLGCPIVIIPFYYWDVRRGVEAGQSQQMTRYIDHALEIFEDVIRQRSSAERPVTQIDLIFDMNNLSFWQLASMRTIEVILDVVRRYEANHPEILHKAVVINASRVFNMLFNIVKPFLAARTLGKVTIYSTQTSEWMSVLHQNIHLDQLPKYFGGTCRTSLKMYFEEDKFSKYRISSLSSRSEVKDNLNTININPGEKVLLTFDVGVPNSILKWEFRTDYYNIQFSVYRDGLENVPCVPQRHYPSWIIKIEGEVKCDIPGEYVAEFSNKCSDIRRAKTLRYHFQVLPPKT